MPGKDMFLIMTCILPHTIHDPTKACFTYSSLKPLLLSVSLRKLPLLNVALGDVQVLSGAALSYS